MIEIWDEGLGDFRAPEVGEPQAGDLIRETLPSGHVITREYTDPVVLDIDDVYDRRLHELYLYAKAQLDARESWYAKGEQYLWGELESEVAAYQADPLEKGRNILAREAAGIPVAKQVTDTTNAAAGLVALVAIVTSNRTVHKDAMRALADADDLAGLLAYDFTTGWPNL